MTTNEKEKTEQEIARVRAEIEQWREAREAACDRVPEHDLATIVNATRIIARLRHELAGLESQLNAA